MLEPRRLTTYGPPRPLTGTALTFLFIVCLAVCSSCGNVFRRNVRIRYEYSAARGHSIPTDIVVYFLTQIWRQCELHFGF
jgi:hypothetical protein